jgi:hypothetical protein
MNLLKTFVMEEERVGSQNMTHINNSETCDFLDLSTSLVKEQ